MSLKTLALTASSFCLVACVSAQPDTSGTSQSCPAEVQSILSPLVGDWTLAIRADEGWTGYGTSSIRWASDQSCGLVELSTSVFNQESQTSLENQSSTILAYDKLSETLKILTGDDRGYVHIGLAAVQTPLSFAIVRTKSAPPTRQIQYRNIQPDAFEWSWQGRNVPSDAWADRLIIEYSKTP